MAEAEENLVACVARVVCLYRDGSELVNSVWKRPENRPYLSESSMKDIQQSMKRGCENIVAGWNAVAGRIGPEFNEGDAIALEQMKAVAANLQFELVTHLSNYTAANHRDKFHALLQASDLGLKETISVLGEMYARLKRVLPGSPQTPFDMIWAESHSLVSSSDLECQIKLIQNSGSLQALQDAYANRRPSNPYYYYSGRPRQTPGRIFYRPRRNFQTLDSLQRFISTAGHIPCETASISQSNTSHPAHILSSLGPSSIPNWPPSSDNNFVGFCEGAWKLTAAENGLRLQRVPNRYFGAKSRWQCIACCFTMPLGKGGGRHDPQYSQELYTHKGTGIRYRWLFLAKTHLKRTQTASAFSIHPSKGPFGCIFCCAEGTSSSAQAFESVDSFMEHLGSHHRRMKRSTLLEQTRSVVGRVASVDEDFDLNIPPQYLDGGRELHLHTSPEYRCTKATDPNKRAGTLRAQVNSPNEKHRLPKDLRELSSHPVRPRGHHRNSENLIHIRRVAGSMLDEGTKSPRFEPSGTSLSKPRTSREDSNGSQRELSKAQEWVANSSADCPTDSSDCSSVPTTVTTPNQDSVTSIDAGSTQHSRFNHILKASEYYEELDSLEIEIAECCGLALGSKVQKGPLSTCFPELGQCMTALEKLGEAGFCGKLFSILVEVPSRPNIAKIIHLSSDEMRGLIHSITSDTIHHEFARTTNVPLQLTQKLLDDPSLECGSGWTPLSFIQFLSTVLPLALVSFSGSHVCRFDINVWGHPEEEITVGFGYSFRLRKLACLKDFVGGPAWVLGKTKNQSTESDQMGLKVSLTVQDLQELWGPVWLVGGTSDRSPIIRTEAGFIIPISAEEQGDNSSADEVECHWTREAPTLPESPIMLTNTSRVLIGTDTPHTAGLAVNALCESKISKIQEQIFDRLQFPGTYNEYYTMEGHEVQLTGGQYVTAGFVRKHKRNPGRTMKSALITECLQCDVHDLKPLLKLRVGLEVSVCTGNARRVTLWDAMLLTHAKQPSSSANNQCHHPTADSKCLQTCWTRACSTDDSVTSQPLMKGVQAREIMVKALLALQNTGIDPNNNLQVLWPFSEAAMTYRIKPTSSSKWLNFLADTRDVATFAVISQRCLEFSEEQYQHLCLNEASPHDQTHRQITCLSTILLPRPVSRRSRRRLLGLHGPSQCHLTALLIGDEFRVSKMNFVVARRAWEQCPKPLIATPRSSQLLSMTASWTGIHDFREQLNPDIKGGEPIEVVVCCGESRRKN